MSFFGNDAVNRVNLHTVIQALADGAGGIFILVFLLQAGVPAPLVLLSMTAMTAGRFMLRPFVLRLARRLGLRRTLMAGTLFEALTFPLLPLVDGPDWAFGAVLAVGPIGSVLYWTCYHAYFASVGDDEHRGGHIGVREAATALAGVVAPLIGAGLLAAGGPWVAFLAAATIQAGAILPLVGAPDVPIADAASGRPRVAWGAAALMGCDGFFSGGYHYVWQVALFISLGESFTAYGGAMALAALAGAGASLWIGRRIDVGRGRSALVIAFVVATGVLAFRALSVDQPWLALTANAMGALVVAVWIPVLMAPLYTMAKASPCPLRFNVATEGAWDIGCGGACAIGAAMTAAGLSYAAPMLLGMAGTVAGVALLWRRYGAAAAQASPA